MLSREEIEEWKKKITDDPIEIQNAPEELKRNPEVIIELVDIDLDTIRQTTENEQHGIYIKDKTSILEYVSEEITNNKEIMMKIIANNGMAIQYASKELRNDYDIVMLAVKSTGYAIEFAGDELKSDINIQKEALKTNPLFWHKMSDDIKYTPEIISIIANYARPFISDIINNIPEDKRTKEIMRSAVEANGSFLEDALADYDFTESERLELINEALEKDPFISNYSAFELDEQSEEYPKFSDEYYKKEREIIKEKEQKIGYAFNDDLGEVGELMYSINNYDDYALMSGRDAVLLGNTKLYKYMTNDQKYILPTKRKGEIIDEIDEQEDEQLYFAYSVGLPVEANKRILEHYFKDSENTEEGYDDVSNFIDYHLSDLMNCLGGKNELIQFIKENKCCLEPHIQGVFDKYLEHLSIAIDNVIKHQEEHSYTPLKIAEGINPREGELEEVINETEELARQNDKEESIEQDGQTQADE